MKFSVSKIHFKKCEVVRQGLRRPRHPRHAARDFGNCAKRRPRIRSDSGELFADARGTLAGQGQQQATLRSETLDESGGSKADFVGDISESESPGADALDHASRGGENFGIGQKAGAR
jgi:hypothetical protein